MANTPNLNLPLIDENATADVPRDMNALAQAVDTNVKAALEDVTVPDATLTQKGITQLSSATDSTSEVLAATPKAVKTAYDRGSEGVDAAGIVQTNLNTHSADNTSHVKYGVDTGTANAKVVTLSPAPVSYVDGMAVSFKNSVQNTGAVTININGLGAKTILKSNGNALSSGNLKANSVYTLRYNGTSFILQGEGGEYGTAGPDQVLTGYTIGTEDGVVPGKLIPGKKYATGTSTSGSTVYNFINDNGLGVQYPVVNLLNFNFIPSVILIYNSTKRNLTAYNSNFNFGGNPTVDISVNGVLLKTDGDVIIDQNTVRLPVLEASTSYSFVMYE